MGLRDIKFPKPVGFLLFIGIFFIGLGFVLPWTITLAKGGILEPDVVNSLQIYSNITWALVGVIFFFFANLLWKKNNPYGDNIGVFSKEETIFKNFTYPQLGLLGLISFSGMFLIMNIFKVLGNGFFGLRVLPTQQFSPIDSLLVSTFQIPFAEESLAFATLGFLLAVLTFVAIKYKWSKSDFNTYKYTFSFIGMAVFGYIWHATVYSTSTINSFVTAIFWGVKALLGLLTGFILIAVEFHATNNFFIDFSRLYSSGTVLGFAIFLIFGLIGLYFYLYRGRLFPFKGG